MVVKKVDERARLVDELDKLFAQISPTDAIVLTAGFIAGTRGYTPVSALIKAAAGLTEGTAAGALYNIDPLLKVSGTWMAAYGGIPGLLAAYLTMWQKPKEDRTAEEQSVVEAYTDVIACGCVGLVEAYAITRPGFISGVGDIVKGVGAIIPG